MSYHYEVMTQEDWLWFVKELPVLAVEDSCGIVAYRGKERIGAIVFDNWTSTSVQASILIKTPFLLKDEFFYKCVDFVFYECNRMSIYALVPSNNIKSFNFVVRMGFIEQCRLQNAFGKGVDTIILELKKENYSELLREAS